jgi:hypothetical protein
MPDTVTPQGSTNFTMWLQWGKMALQDSRERKESERWSSWKRNKPTRFQDVKVQAETLRESINPFLGGAGRY